MSLPRGLSGFGLTKRLMHCAVSTVSPAAPHASRRRLGDLDQIRSSRRAAARASDRPHDERFPTLCDSKGTENRVGGSCRASFHPLGLPVCVASQSSGCRVFSCASPTCLRNSKPLGSLHVAAYSRSAGPSKVEIPSSAAEILRGDTVSSPLEARISSKFVIACKSSSDEVSTATRNQWQPAS